MSMDLGWIIFLYSFSLFITLALFIYTALQSRIYPGAGQFSLIVLIETLWIFGNISELLSPTLEQKLFWDNVQWPPVILAGLATAWFAMTYTKVQPARTRLLMTAALLVWLGLETFQMVSLFGNGPRPGIGLETRGEFTSLIYPFLPADYLVMAYQYLLILASLIHLILWSMRQPNLYRTQAVMVLVGFIIPVVGTASGLVNTSVGPQRDLSPMMFAAGNLIVTYGLFHLGLFNMVHAARDKAVENMRDPLVVMDAYDRITSVNRAAQSVFKLKPGEFHGKYAPDILPSAICLTCYSPEDEIQREVQLETFAQQSSNYGQPDPLSTASNTYEMSILPILARYPHLKGRILILHDITLRKQNEEIQRQINEERVLRQSYEATIAGWSKALELRDKETLGHSERVTELSLLLARKFGIEGEDLQDFKHGVLLHDIGKMGIPDAILLKEGPLNEAEWAIMRQHPQFAKELLAGIDYLCPALLIAYFHHERWNGSGYPQGLEGENIPLWARLFAVVDVWDALTNDRPYRPAWSQESAVDYLIQNAGILFDPNVVQVFIHIVKPVE